MPRTLRDFPDGLVLQFRPEIDEAETGQLQSTLRFLLANDKYPRLNPARKTLCSDFPAGDDKTSAVMASLDYLGKHSSRFTRSGHAPGIGILEILCQGAVFTDPDDEDAITTPFDPSSTTKDSTSFIVYFGGVGTISANVATTANLPATYAALVLTASANGRLVIDGVKPSAGNYVLVKDQTTASQNGVYQVIDLGRDPYTDGSLTGRPWKLKRVPELDESSEVTLTVFVVVLTGTTNARTTWHCTSSGITLDSGAINFEAVADSVFTPRFNVTLTYYAIDLHFEYIARKRVARPRFLQREYTLDEEGFLIIDPITHTTLELFVEKISASPASYILGSVDVAATEAAIEADETIWRNSVKYVGVGSRFEQTPSGPYFRVVETTTIKIQPLNPAASQVTTI
jgi:hypothetical protein